MKFYDRTKELRKLQDLRELSFSDHSRLTVVTGRRRVGKTALITHSHGKEPMVYFFVSRKNEASLCAGFCKEIASKLDISVPSMTSFEDVFIFLMQIGKTRKFTLVVDEFQEFYNINPSVYSEIQNHWDRMRLETNINFIVSGSIYSLMGKIFKDNREPLFGRADAMMKLGAFSTDILKEILHDYNPEYTPDDLLALYMMTGGVAKYVELMMDNKATDVRSMIRTISDPDSPMRDEGKNLLIEEFGRNYGTYFSILDAISSGRNTQSEISELLGDKSIGGQLAKLEDVFEVIDKVRPIMSKPGTQNVRYYIKDQFLEFWFRYFEGNRGLVEMGLSEQLEKTILADYNTYSGHVLEKYFKQRLKESGQYYAIGSYWKPRKGADQREVDIVALDTDKRKALVAEVKRQRKEFRKEVFQEKVQHLKNTILPKLEIDTRLFTLDDM